MTCIDRILVTGVALLAVILVSSSAKAVDQGITGKKLLLKSKPKMVLLSQDALVVPGANGSSSDPRCVADGGSGSGAMVKLDDGTNSVTLDMPCANWATNGPGTMYKYKDTAGAPKSGKIKAGLLQVASPDMGGFPVPNGAATVNVEVTVGTDTYCLTFSGTGDGGRFLVKDAAMGSCVVACADSGTPMCGGSCPNGQVCQFHGASSCTDCSGLFCAFASADCLCVPADGTCDGLHLIGICGPPADTPFTYGPCAFGSACIDVSTPGESARFCIPYM